MPDYVASLMSFNVGEDQIGITFFHASSFILTKNFTPRSLTGQSLKKFLGGNLFTRLVSGFQRNSSSRQLLDSAVLSGAASNQDLTSLDWKLEALI